jgi:N-acetylmuramoyl-L-alanine amidase
MTGATMSNSRIELEKLSEADLLARCIWGEARGESIRGKLAVAHVVLNRVNANSYYGSSIKEVILKPLHFSCFNENNPNLAKILSLNSSNPDLAYCQAVADVSLLTGNPDPTGGATHYYAAHVKPSWVSSPQMKFLCKIGNHLFYRESLASRGMPLALRFWFSPLRRARNQQPGSRNPEL